jgi:hypothetical protein
VSTLSIPLQFVFCLRSIFKFNGKSLATLLDLFSDDRKLLENVYIELFKIVAHLDHDGKYLAEFCTLNPEFIFKILDLIYSSKTQISGRIRIDTRQTEWIWLREDYMDYFEKIYDFLFGKESGHWFDLGNIVKKFFGLRKSDSIEEIQSKQKNMILHLIEKHSKEILHINTLLCVIHDRKTISVKDFLCEFLSHNKDYKAFDSLQIEPMIKSYSGSRVPTLNKEKEQLESLLGLVEDPCFLDHRLAIENRIGWVEDEISSSKKEDFVELH